MPHIRPFFALSAVLACLSAPPVLAQESGEEEPRRTRIALGPQIVPSYPGSEDVSVRPFFDLSRARGDAEFEFEAPDEGFGFALLRSDRFSAGPSLGFEGKRSSSDVGGALPEVDISIELGAFAQYQLSDSVRLRAEGRQGVTGHDGFIANLGADYVWREGDRQLFSIGPRVTVTDSSYQNAYFGVRPEDAAASGLTEFDADGGVQAVGATAGYIRQLTKRWGIYSYAKYDRLVGDPADSPLVERFGSRNQFSGGLALTYTFGRSIP
ncbi:MipA/OmpV family protein [Novosphingobium aquimarinum]|uniref:MipA/OmpV family protein n=1 Tax=Novosphingobium aquimarinum TaxID=2682494 RepID=UPI0012EC520D|nr:MipA/OmpV family protein [Novosphingobium aquimarinum]